MPKQADDAPRSAWHEMLRTNDNEAHRREASRSVVEAVAVLEDRLAEANASRHALTEALALRDRLLAQQSARMGEIDDDALRLMRENELLRQRLADLEIRPLRTLPRRTVRRLRRSLSSQRPQ